jgi:hypothetical protein
LGDPPKVPGLILSGANFGGLVHTEFCYGFFVIETTDQNKKNVNIQAYT